MAFSLNIDKNLGSPRTKRILNEQLFTEVAPKYDRITKILSFGRDRYWKRSLINSLPDLKSPLCLDVACGTGDLCYLLAAKYLDARIVGLDLTRKMLEIAQGRNGGRNIHFVNQDMGFLGFDDAIFDIVTGCYALRNAPSIDQAIAELYRITKPGGTCAILDFSKPKNKSIQTIEYQVLRFWGRIWGQVFHRNGDVYGYIAESLKRYPDRQNLHGMLRKNGFEVTQSILYFGGVIELLILTRKSDSDLGI